MTRKYARDSLEELFQGIEQLRREVDGLTNAKEKTLPFRAMSNMPPGIEGQWVIAEYVPGAVELGNLALTVFLTEDDGWPSYVVMEASTGDSLSLYTSNDLYDIHRMVWYRDRSEMFLEGLATGIIEAYDSDQTWGLWTINLDATGFTRLITLPGEPSSSYARSIGNSFIASDFDNKFIEMPDGELKVIRMKYEALESHASGTHAPSSWYVYDDTTSTTTQIVGPGDFISQFRYGVMGISDISQDGSKFVFGRSNQNNDFSAPFAWRSYVVDMDGTNLTQIDAPTSASYLTLIFNTSDNGELIYLAADGIHVTYADGSPEAGSIWMWDVGEDITVPVFSPDGAFMATTVGGYGTKTLKIISADGATTVSTGVPVMEDSFLSWHPSGNHIAIIEDIDNTYTEVKIFDIDLSEVTIIHASDPLGLSYTLRAMWDRKSSR